MKRTLERELEELEVVEREAIASREGRKSRLYGQTRKGPRRLIGKGESNSSSQLAMLVIIRRIKVGTGLDKDSTKGDRAIPTGSRETGKGRYGFLLGGKKALMLDPTMESALCRRRYGEYEPPKGTEGKGILGGSLTWVGGNFYLGEEEPRPTPRNDGGKYSHISLNTEGR